MKDILGIAWVIIVEKVEFAAIVPQFVESAVPYFVKYKGFAPFQIVIDWADCPGSKNRLPSTDEAVVVAVNECRIIVKLSNCII